MENPQNDDTLEANAVISELQNTISQIELNAWLMRAYGEIGLSVTDELRMNMVKYAERYGHAYSSFESILKQGKQRAEDIQEWFDATAGIAIGVTAGMLAPGLLGAAAVVKVMKEVLSAELQAALSKGLKSNIVPDVSGKNLVPDKQSSPLLMESKLWKNIADAYHNIAIYLSYQPYLTIALSHAHYVISQLEKIDRNEPADMKHSELMELYISINNLKNIYLRTDLNKMTTKFQKLKAHIPKELPSERHIEQNIFLKWMSEISDSDILDLDPIERHLEFINILKGGNSHGERSRLGFGFGHWTSKEETRKVISLAKSEICNLDNLQRENEAWWKLLR